MSTTTSKMTRPASVGIRAERGRTWERRTPLTPDAVATLVSAGVQVQVQPSEKRVFRDEEYEKAGAQLTPNLTTKIILGIKEVPAEDLVSDVTYAFFTHTHKGQLYNLPLLRKFLSTPRSRFLDWELLTSSAGGPRTAAFGWHAGFSAMVDALALLGPKLLAATGSYTPLLELVRPHQVAEGVQGIKKQLKKVGEEWAKRGGGGKKVGPVTVVIAGRGRVGKGAASVLDELPTVWLSMKELKKAVEDPATNLTKLYACHLELSDYLTHKDGKPFDREEYREYPGRFVSDFDTKVAPWTTLFLNGGFWKEGCPRVLTTEQLAKAKRAAPSRMLAICDAACDFGGALEFVTFATTVDAPTVQFDPSTGEIHPDPSKPGSVQLSSVEIYPTTVPLDASEHFSSCILPYVKSLVADPTCAAQDDLATSLRRSIVVEDEKLAEAHEGLSTLLDQRRRKVVMLGSGLVAGPAVQTLVARKDLDVVIASNDLKAADALAAPYPNATTVSLDVADQAALATLVESADVVLSLLPAPLHVGVAKLCIEHGTSLVTASYVSPEMAALDAEAKAAGIVLLNELGLDPGIDHASAMRLIEEAREAGNTITSFVSFCGGLPSPELSNGPLGYKFSWSPRGVLTAALNSALFRVNSQTIKIDGKNLLSSSFSDVPIIRGFSFEGVANRDSLSYLSQYGLPDDLPTILRGTLRYGGFVRTVDAFKKLGLLSMEPLATKLESWEELVDQVLGTHGYRVVNREERKAAIAALVGDDVLAEDVLATLEELSLAPSSKPRPASAKSLPALPSAPQAPIDLLSILMGSELAYGPAERDAVILHHELGTVTSDDPPVEELFTSTLVQYGDKQNSAMATTVGMPIALGALLCLDGKIKSRGLVSPAAPEVWKPLLVALEERNLRFEERRTKGAGRGVLEHLEKQV